MSEQVEPRMYFLWSAIQNHLDLEGLEVVIRVFPELKLEAERLAKPKRLTEGFRKIVTQRPTT